MDERGKIEVEKLIRRMRAEFEQTMKQVAQAVNDAPDGHWIDASEEPARQALGEFRRKAYEQAIQMRVETSEDSAAFSPSETGVAPARRGGSIGGDGQRPD